MESRTLHICVYRVEFANGDVAYESKHGDLSERHHYNSVKDMAEMTVLTAETFHYRRLPAAKDVVTTIVFRSNYDIEYPSYSEPRRCFPLTKEEEDEFWKYFRL